MPSYELLGPYLDFVVRGKPVPQGAVRHFGRGKPSAYANQKDLLPWREQIQHAAEAALESGGGGPFWSSPEDEPVFPLGGPVALVCEFTMAKPASAPKTKRTYPITRPDASKLLRTVEDALVAAGCYRDDAQLVQVTALKAYPNETMHSLPVPGVRVLLYGIQMSRRGEAHSGTGRQLAA